MNPLSLVRPLGFALACLPACLGAQIVSYTTIGSEWIETFNLNDGTGWVSTATTVPWVDGVSVPGWQALYLNGNDGLFAVPALFRMSQGNSSSTTSLYVFRADANPEDGSLGIRPFDGQTGLPANNGGVFFGVEIRNDTDAPITEFSLGYTGVQWWQRTGAANTFLVSYSTTAEGLNSGTWTEIAALAYTAPLAGTDVQLDGSARQVLTPALVVLTDALAPGESLWLRWFSANVTGVDQSIAIDDVRFTAIPEPGTVALMLLGGGVIALAARRRRC